MLRCREIGVGGPLWTGIGEEMLEGETDLAGFLAIADGEGELTDLPLS